MKGRQAGKDRQEIVKGRQAGKHRQEIVKGRQAGKSERKAGRKGLKKDRPQE